MRNFFCLLFVLSLFVLAVSAQPPEPKSGTVTDENGKPIVDTAVRLLKKLDRGGSMNFYLSSLYLMNRTDDRGVYRLFGLPPGKYLVCVGSEQYNSSPQRRYGGTYYPQTFFPGVTKEADAKVVEVSAESESKDVDIKLGKAEKTYAARGRILDATMGTPIVGLRVGHTLISSDGRYGTVGQERTNLQGDFEIRGLSPGSYLVYLASDEGVNYYTEPKKFEILSNDVNGLELKATPGSSLSGTVVIEGTKDATLLADLANLALFCRSEQADDIPSSATMRILLVEDEVNAESFVFCGSD